MQLARGAATGEGLICVSGTDLCSGECVLLPRTALSFGKQRTPVSGNLILHTLSKCPKQVTYRRGHACLAVCRAEGQWRDASPRNSLNTHSTDQDTEAGGGWQLVPASGRGLVRAALTLPADPEWR